MANRRCAMKHLKWPGTFGAAALITFSSVAEGLAEERNEEKKEEHARSFSELPNYLSLGDTVFVTDTSGRTVKATITDFEPNRLQVTKDGAELVFAEDTVHKIDVQYNDSLLNGALIGAAIGAAIAMPFALSDEWAATPASIPVTAGMGAGIGAGFDALRKGRRRAYQSPVDQGAQVWVFPILTRDAKGISLSISL
jgi:hypothetical protein